MNIFIFAQLLQRFYLLHTMLLCDVLLILYYTANKKNIKKLNGTKQLIEQIKTTGVLYETKNHYDLGLCN